MNIPGTDLETEDPIEERDPALGAITEPEAEADEDTDPDLIETVKFGETKMAPVGKLIEQRKANKELKAENAALKAQQEAINAQIAEFRPYADAIKANPQLIDMVQGKTRPTAPTTVQPQDDTEAQQWADENGLITATGELDIARARRQLDHLDKIAEKRIQREIGPLRQNEAQRTAQSHLEQAKRVTLKDGNPVATAESMEQAFQMLPVELTSDRNVAAMLPIFAAGLDVIMGRRQAKASTQVEYDDPILSESPANRRGTATLSSDTQRLLQRVGVSEKEFSASKYVPGRPVELE